VPMAGVVADGSAYDEQVFDGLSTVAGSDDGRVQYDEAISAELSARMNSVLPSTLGAAASSGRLNREAYVEPQFTQQEYRSGIPELADYVSPSAPIDYDAEEDERLWQEQQLRDVLHERRERMQAEFDEQMELSQSVLTYSKHELDKSSVNMMKQEDLLHFLEQTEEESAAERVQQREIYERQSALKAYESEIFALDARGGGGGTAGALSSYR